MSQPICFIAFGTFGNPNGFKQTFFIGGDANIAGSIRTFDLKTDAIKLFPKSRLYVVRKEIITGAKAVSYSLYTYAKEPNSDRGGTFIGSGILYLNNRAEENRTISSLNEFHDNIVSRNIQNGVINVNHSDKLIVSKPSHYEALLSDLKEIEDLNFTQYSGKHLVVYSEINPAKLEPLFKKTMNLLAVYDAVYFTSSNEVAEFVHQKKLFQLVQADGFEQELLKLQEERKQRVLALVAEYEQEKQKLEEDKKKVLAEWKEQLETNEKAHQQNKIRLEESKQEFSQVVQNYEGYAKRIEDAIAQLASGKNITKVRQLLAENKRIFIESVNEPKKPVFINTIPKPEVKTETKPGFQPDAYKTESTGSTSRRRKHRRQRVNPFKIASFVLLLLWVGTIFYFLFFAKKENNLAELPKPEVQAPVIIQSAPVIPELNPKPNTKLTGKAFYTIIKNMKPHASADEVVNIIFDSNTTEIGKIYAVQKEAYKKYLVEQNRDYFEKKDSVFYVKNDTLVVIPGYKDSL